MDLVPFLGEHFRLLPGQGLDGPVVLQDRELDSLQLGIKPDCKLGLTSPIRDSEEMFQISNFKFLQNGSSLLSNILGANPLVFQ